MMLRVKGNHKAFFIRYMSPVTKKRREMAIGAYGVYSLKQARDRAAELRMQIGDGTDPLYLRDENLKSSVKRQRAKRRQPTQFQICLTITSNTKTNFPTGPKKNEICFLVGMVATFGRFSKNKRFVTLQLIKLPRFCNRFARSIRRLPKRFAECCVGCLHGQEPGVFLRVQIPSIPKFCFIYCRVHNRKTVTWQCWRSEMFLDLWRCCEPGKELLLVAWNLRY